MKSNCGANVFFGTFVTFGRRSVPIPVIPYTDASASLPMVKSQENEINILCKDDILYLGRPIIYLLW